VLITLAIIGVIAAITIPSLIQNHRNSVVETRLAKFYQTMNNAINLAELEHGDRTSWYVHRNKWEYEEDGKTPIIGSSIFEKQFETYLKKYLNVIKVEHCAHENFCAQNNMFAALPIYYLADGSAFTGDNDYVSNWIFFPGNPEKCLEKYDNPVGICAFSFYYSAAKKSGHFYRRNNNMTFQPFSSVWDGVYENLFNVGFNSDYACNKNGGGFYCTAVIFENGWKIPKNYPFKVSY